MALLSPPLILVQEVSRVRMRGVTAMGVDWASEEASDLVESTLNLVLHMHLRIFAYRSHTLISSFEYMECMLASGTWKNVSFSFGPVYSLSVSP